MDPTHHPSNQETSDSAGCWLKSLKSLSHTQVVIQIFGFHTQNQQQILISSSTEVGNIKTGNVSMFLRPPTFGVIPGFFDTSDLNKGCADCWSYFVDLCNISTWKWRVETWSCSPSDWDWGFLTNWPDFKHQQERWWVSERLWVSSYHLAWLGWEAKRVTSRLWLYAC